MGWWKRFYRNPGSSASTDPGRFYPTLGDMCGELPPQDMTRVQTTTWGFIYYEEIKNLLGGSFTTYQINTATVPGGRIRIHRGLAIFIKLGNTILPIRGKKLGGICLTGSLRYEEGWGGSGLNHRGRIRSGLYHTGCACTSNGCWAEFDYLVSSWH